MVRVGGEEDIDNGIYANKNTVNFYSYWDVTVF